MGNQRLKNIIFEQRLRINKALDLIHNAPIPSDEALDEIEKILSGKETK